MGPITRIARLPVYHHLSEKTPFIQERQPIWQPLLYNFLGMEVLGVSFFRDETMSWLSRGLDAAALRQQVTAHNLANLNTPRFKRSDVSFEDQLSKARAGFNTSLARTHEKHFPHPAGPDIRPRIKTDTTTIRRIDGNNVDIEREMLNMVSNQIRYNAYTQQINTRFNNWRTVINEGRR